MTTDDYTDPTKWMELPCGEPPPNKSMNSQTEQPPLSNEELKKKLEELLQHNHLQPESANDLLRACLTALKRGEADAKILDAIDKHMISLSHTRATHSVMMCGTTIHGQFENLDRANGGGSFRKVKGRNIREAVLSAITTSNQQEAE